MFEHDLASRLPSPARLLSAALAATIVAGLAVSSVGVWAVSDSLASAAEIARREEHTAYVVSSLGHDLARLRAHLLGALELGPVERPWDAAPAAEARTILAQTKSSRRALPSLLGEAESEIWNRLEPRVERMVARLELAIAALEEGEVAQAKQLLYRAEREASALATELGEFERVSVAETEAAIDDVHRHTARRLELVSLAKLGVLATVVVAWFLVLRIVAAQRRALAVQIERLEASNRDLEAFAGRVAHDMRNVLSPIQLGTSAIATNARDPTTRALATRLERACGRGRELVDGLLAFSRATDTHHEGADPCAELGREVDDVLDQLETSLDEAAIDVSKAVPDGCQVALPSPLLHAVLLNVVDNAVKLMRGRPERRLTIVARLSAHAATIAISDTGPGIPAEERPRVFEALYRGAGPRHEGTGLGLATVKRILESHGGHIEIAASSDRGTTFLVRLPRARAAPEATRQTSSTTPAPAAG